MNKKIIISVYDKFATETDILTTNGLAILDNICIDLNSTEELDSGNYTLDGTFLIDDDGLYKYLQEEYILKVLCDYGYEIFSISKVESGTRYIDITARQITIAESLGIHLEDVRPEGASGQEALNHLLANADKDNKVRIRLNSDITSTGTAYYEDKSLYEALHTADNNFLKVWGGEVQRRGFNLNIDKKIGIDRGVSIREGKNLTGFSGSSNIDSVYTKVRGKGYNGLLGNWQESNLINNYPRIYTKTFEYKVRVRESGQTEDENYTYFDTEAQAKAELDRLAALEFTDNEVDKIKADYSINFVELDKTEEYKEYKLAERCYIGDTIRVYIPRMNVDISVRIVKREFNHLTQMVTESELSNYISAKAVSLKNIKDTLEKLSETQEDYYKEALEFASNLIKNGNVDSYAIMKKDEFLVMNTKDINTATKVWRWNNNGLGFSSTGYNGTYSTALTSNGQINASRILTGILKAITISNMDGSFQIDLSGTEGADLYSDGKKALSLNGTSIKFYNWGKDGDYIGSIGCVNTQDSSHPSGNPNKPNITIKNDFDSSISLNYMVDDSTNTSKKYILFDKYKVQDNTDVPITICEDTQINKQLHMKNYLKMHSWTLFLSDNMKSSLRPITVNQTYTSTETEYLWVDNKLWVAKTQVTGGDYAEMFEWLDENTENEDRIGYLVELEGDKIIKANGTDILGIISGTASVVGDNANEWVGKYKTDKWGRYLLDDEGNKIISDDYDKSKEYLDRSSRNEWGVVGLVGKIFTRQDGSLSIGDYVQAINGIATKSTEKTNIKVINIIDDETVKVFIR